MVQNKSNKGRRSSNYDFVYIDEKQQFDVEEYIQNPAMIRKLHAEKAGAYSVIIEQKNELEHARISLHQLELQKQELDLRLNESVSKFEKVAHEKAVLDEAMKTLQGHFEVTKQNNHQMELQKQELNLKFSHAQQKLSEMNQASLTKFFTSTAAAIMLGFGVNAVTSAPSDWKGWMIIAASIVLGVIAYFIPRKGE